MNFIIDCQIYPFHIMVHFGNKKDLIMNLKKYGINLSQKDIKGKYKSLFLNDNQTVLYMDIIPKTIDELSILQHENFHCVMFILDKIGIKLSYKTDEIYAYLIQYITKQIYLKISPTSFS